MDDNKSSPSCCTADLNDRRYLFVHPGAQLSHVAVQLVPALHQGRHPRHPLLGDLVHLAPPLPVPLHLPVRVVVSRHLEGGGGRLLQDLDLGFTLVLEVLAKEKS